MAKQSKKTPDIEINIQQQPPAAGKVIITPVRVEATDNPSLHQHIDIPIGHALIVPVKDGSPNYEKSTFYPLKDVDKRFGNKPNWHVIKGEQTIIENTKIYESLSRESKRIIQTVRGGCRTCG